MNPQHSLGLICAVRVADHTGARPGATIGHCPRCRQPILLSRASRERMARGYVAYCSVCITASAASAIQGNGTPVKVDVEFPTAEEMREAGGMTGKN